MEVTLSLKGRNGLTVTVKTECGEWSDVINFIRDFKTNIRV